MSLVSRMGNIPRKDMGIARPAVLSIAKLLVATVGLPLVRSAPLLPLSTEKVPSNEPGLWVYLGTAIALVLLGGAFAGLTIALMGQSELHLQVIATSGEGSEKRNAAKVLKLLKRGKHWVLVTLLLSNVITNETLPIVLDRSLGGGWPAVLTSTILIVIFGEIVPQSICVRYGLPIGAWMSPVVLGLMWIMAPVAWPTAKLLDKLLGEDHGTTYKKAGLKTLVTLHKTLGSSPEERLNQDEVTIISAVLDLKDKPVGNIMTPMNDVFVMSADTILNEDVMDAILSAGYSRIPIHAPNNERDFVGMLLVKMLITYDPEDCLRVRDFALATLPETRPETSCLDIVNFFQEGKSHMVLVSDYPGEPNGALGVVTLEDVIEELIGEEIIDESDVFIDVHKAIRRLAPAPRTRVPKGEVLAPTAKPTELEDTGVGSGVGPSMDRKLSAPDFATSPKTTTFLMRRRSSGSAAAQLQMRGNDPELRQHLKHLGPSNAASRPKQTKINSVKIKPGIGTIPEHVNLPTKTKQEPMNSGGKDGAQALTYGTLQDAMPRRTNSHSTIASLRSRSISPPPRTTTARSGSITENIIDHHGVKKLILETTSSSDEGVHVEVETKPAEEGEGSVGGKSKKKRKKRASKKKKDAKDGETEPLLGGQGDV